jgi:hypothetical protein
MIPLAALIVGCASHPVAAKAPPPNVLRSVTVELEGDIVPERAGPTSPYRIVHALADAVVVMLPGRSDSLVVRSDGSSDRTPALDRHAVGPVFTSLEGTNLRVRALNGAEFVVPQRSEFAVADGPRYAERTWCTDGAALISVARGGGLGRSLVERVDVPWRTEVQGEVVASACPSQGPVVLATIRPPTLGAYRLDTGALIWRVDLPRALDLEHEAGVLAVNAAADEVAVLLEHGGVLHARTSDGGGVKLQDFGGTQPRWEWYGLSEGHLWGFAGAMAQSGSDVLPSAPRVWEAAYAREGAAIDRSWMPRSMWALAPVASSSGVVALFWDGGPALEVQWWDRAP